jgi:hypothetical protein
MPALGNILPVANSTSSGEAETALPSNAHAASSDPFDQVMSRALSPDGAGTMATPSRRLRTNFSGAQNRNASESNLPTAPAKAAHDSPAAATDSGTPAKTETGVKLGNEAGKDVKPTKAAVTFDAAENTPIFFLAPTLAAYLLKPVMPAAAQKATADNPAVAAVLPAGVEAKPSAAPVTIIPGLEAATTQAVADAVSQLASGRLPKPAPAKNFSAEKIPAEKSAAKAETKASGVPAVVPKISELAESPDSMPKKVAPVPADDLPSDEAGDFVFSQNPAAAAAPTASAKPHGTSVAKQDVPMKNTEQTNKVAGPGEKVLPGDAIPVARENNLPGRASSLPVSARVVLPETNVATVSTAADSPVRSAGSVEVAAAISNVTDIRSQALERTHDLMALHATRLVGSSSDSLQVVIKPDAGTQLSLELRQRGGGIEAQAVLQSGDLENLKQHWPELQQRLEQRGIKLAPLTSAENFASWSGSQGFKHQPDQPAEREPIFSGAFAGFVPAAVVNNLPDEPAIQTASSRGWQTWA